MLVFLYGLKQTKEKEDISLAIFNDLKKAFSLSNNNKSSTGYVELGDYDQDIVSKAIRPGRASARGSVDGIDISDGSEEGRFGVASISDTLNMKRTLKAYAENDIVQAIIRTRTNQVLSYSNPSRFSRSGVGFRVDLKDKDAVMSKPQIKRAHEIEDFIYNTGNEFYDWRDTFPRFLTKIINDMYVQDQINIERIFKPGTNEIDHFNVVDASKVVISYSPRSKDQPRKFEQYVNDSKSIPFSERNLTFITYWNLSDTDRKGYGYSPVEASRSLIRAIYDTEQFNARFFSQGGTTRGILVVDQDGDAQANQMMLAGIRRQWTNQGSGMPGAWKIPLLVAKDAKFVNMTQNSRDMEFDKFLNFMIYDTAAIFQMQPEEINFPNNGGATGKSANKSVNEGSTAKAKLDASKDKGLTPLLSFIEQVINDKIMRYIDKDYRFSFTLGDAQDELQQENIWKQRLANGYLINEYRKANGLKEIEGLNVPGTVGTTENFINATGMDQPNPPSDDGSSGDNATEIGQREKQERIQHSKDYKKGKDDPKSPLPKPKTSDNEDISKPDDSQQ